MGGGNAQKSATARARNAEKAKKAKGGASQLKQNQAAQTNLCTICRTSFICTMSRAALEEHVKSKHEKSTFDACFPNYGK